MAVSLEYVMEHQFDIKKLDEIEKYVDSKLRSPNFISKYRSGVEDNYWWRITVTESFSEKEIEKFQLRYKEAGWGDVLISNNGDKGDLPGLATITLYQKKSQTV